MNVFRYSGNIGSGNHYSGNLIFAQDFEQGRGKKTGRIQTSNCAFGKDAYGNCRFCNLAGAVGSFYAALEERSFSLSLCSYWPDSNHMDSLLGGDWIPQEIADYLRLDKLASESDV